MGSPAYHVCCVLCSREIGRIRGHAFARHACPNPLPRIRGKLRCCHCGGSLYLEPDLEASAHALTPAELAYLNRRQSA